MKSIFENVIEHGAFNLADMLKKIDTHHINGNLSDEERDELIIMARQRASAEHSTDMFNKLLELEKRITALEAKSDSPESESETEVPEEYVPGKWYYGGTKVMFKGKVRTCTAPEGVVCTWSPDEYPPYWD